MLKLSATTLFAAVCFAQAATAGELPLFSRDDFGGRQITLLGNAPNLSERGFNDRASSMIVGSGRWEVCENIDFGGRCAVVEPGEYPTVERFGNRISSVRELKTQGRGVELFSRARFGGESLPFGHDIKDLGEFSFNDRAGSLVVHTGTWKFCQDVRYRGRCVIMRPGRYEHLRLLDNQISSVKRVR
jgi:hypothetical protein